MKITGSQRNAASWYWSQILTGELMPSALLASKKKLTPMMLAMGTINRKSCMEDLAITNPLWNVHFMGALESLLLNADVSVKIELDYQLTGILKEAANKAKLSSALFPMGKLCMSFDDKGNIIVGGETINAADFLKEACQESNTLSC
ncbi:hypothetical protein Lqui_2440 [Legionella quinlivanii]|uniref:Uncharacterized protein n=1 Tax=Legionella quinlivanii TaxID=45073 RepID=A0A0W0XSI1_9GAMM|nr:hypothetical protein [Legionella quinlivanii]KTD47514.1 hypothetical protein Lqui_2440 [Legionella quinlivanii]SEG50280.1 hypothetical protein SAMN02746093_03175 [Legionella quinlivanii DSM 21216]STY49798.1 Uncharacterised protein [Legionella quinlivanii]